MGEYEFIPQHTKISPNRPPQPPTNTSNPNPPSQYQRREEESNRLEGKKGMNE